MMDSLALHVENKSVPSTDVTMQGKVYIPTHIYRTLFLNYIHTCAYVYVPSIAKVVHIRSSTLRLVPR